MQIRDDGDLRPPGKPRGGFLLSALVCFLTPLHPPRLPGFPQPGFFFSQGDSMSKQTLALIASLISKGQARIVVKRGKVMVVSDL